MKTWVKLYTEILDDPDVGTLSWAERGMLSAMFSLAGKIDDRDADDMETGRLDTLERVAWHLRCDLDELQAAVNAFIAREFLDVRDDVLYLTHYPGRQAHSPSEDRNAVAERVKRYRAHKAEARNEDVTPLQSDDNGEVTHLEKKREEKKREEKREITEPISSPSRSIPHDVIPERESLRSLYQAYQRGNGWPEGESIPTSEIPALRKLLDDGLSPPDVEVCTRWLRSDPYWSERIPPVASVHKRIAEWTAKGKPDQWLPPKANGNGRRQHETPEVSESEVRAIQARLSAARAHHAGTSAPASSAAPG